jgi:uncharacterized protein (TIGR02246 family)
MRSKFQLAALIAFIALVFSACSDTAVKSDAVDLTKLKAEIQAMEDAYAAGEKAKDAAAVAAYYSDDAISYNRDDKPSSGKEAIKARLADRLAKDTSGNVNSYKVVDLFADGNTVVEIGSWTETNPAGAEVNTGHYMSVFQKRDGKWACVRDMSVSSNPRKPM